MKTNGIAAALLLLAGCASGHQLDVDLRTDFTPGTDFARIVVTVAGRETATLNATTVHGNLLDGARVLERNGLAGDVDVRVTLADALGGTIASRGARVHLTADYALTIVIARSCLGVICPRPTDPGDATECNGGRCVSPDCVPSAAMSCGATCTSDVQCGSPVPCAVGACALGSCFVEPVDARCGSGMRCDVVRGCVSVSGAPDGGLPDGGVSVCGDGHCNGGETCSSCSGDCGACAPRCGDTACNGSETCATCVGDCGTCPPVCGDHTCNGSENCSTCPGDCGACPPGCGDLACNGTETCHTCPGDCGACPPACGDLSCNGSETCGTCAGDCGACPPFCGDLACNGGESCGTCPGDCGGCGPVCGNAVCELGEDCFSCVGDCGNGHLGSGENGDPCWAAPETWRCVFIPSFGTYGSQVCRDGSWLTYVLNPTDCNACCGAETSACYPP